MTEEEIIEQTLASSDYPDIATLQTQRWLDCALPFEQAHFLDGFAWPDGKFRFRPEWPTDSQIPDFPDHWDVIDAPSDDKPFRLITPPARNFLNSSFTETPWAVQREQSPRGKLYTADAEKLGIDDGMPITIGNERGEVQLTAEITQGIARGTVVVEGVWPGHAFANGKGINHLTSADSPAPAGGAVFHDTAVWVRPI